MSDIHDDKPKIDQDQMPDLDFVVKHGGEPVTEAHDFRTPLDQAPVHEVSDTVEEFVSLEPTRSNRKGLKVSLGVVGAGGLVALGALLAGGRGESEDNNSPTTTEEQATGTSTESPTETRTPTVENSEFGLYGLPLGSDFITAVRPNGEEIQIARLDDSTPNALASTALNLMACYLTTGSQECLSAFSSREDVQKYLENWRNEDMVEVFETPGTDAQLVIMESPDNPVIFSHLIDDSGLDAVELTSGTLYLGRAINNFGGSNEWQSPDFASDFGILEQTIDSLRIVYGPNGQDELEVAGLDISLSLSES